MSNINHEENGVNEYGINDEVVSPGRCPADQQRRPGRNPTTAGTRRRKWTRVENEVDVILEANLRKEDTGKELSNCGGRKIWRRSQNNDYWTR